MQPRKLLEDLNFVLLLHVERLENTLKVILEEIQIEALLILLLFQFIFGRFILSGSFGLERPGRSSEFTRCPAEKNVNAQDYSLLLIQMN